MLLVNSTPESVKNTVLVISASDSIKRGLRRLWWLHLNSEIARSLWTTHLNPSMRSAYELCAWIHKIYRAFEFRLWIHKIHRAYDFLTWIHKIHGAYELCIWIHNVYGFSEGYIWMHKSTNSQFYELTFLAGFFLQVEVFERYLTPFYQVHLVSK
jgi:hypothetical protein